MDKELRILILEDVPVDAELMERELRRGGIKFSSKRVDTRKAFLKELKEFEPDLILGDYKLPSFGGLSALEIVQKKCPDLPFIFVSGAIGEESALETLKKGATDYVLKDRLFRLVPAVDRALREVGQRAEREQAEEALRESEGRFRTLFEAIPDNVLVHDNEGVILHINEIGAQQLEWSAKDLIGKNLHEILAPEQKPLIADHIRETHKIGWSRFETTYVSRSNWKIEVEVNDRLIKFGEKKAILCVSRDITERKEAEKALLRERNFSNSVINSSPDLLFVFGGKGNIIRWNSNAENITGYSAKEIAKMNIMDFVAEEDSKAAAEAAQEAFATGQASVEINLRSKSGKLIPFYIIGRRTKIENTDCIVCTGIDITERRRAEEEVKRSYEQLHETLISTVNALAATVEMKDQYTAGHQSRVAQLTCAIAQAMGLSEERIEGIRMAASIHDIGKLIVPTEILNKPGTLTEIQFNMIKMHPQTGYDILKGIEFPWPVAQIILQHHELMDGSGYPQGLSGENIMLEARILTVADVVEAMTSHRPYRPAYHIRKAIAEISKNGGALYDPEVVDACIKLFTEKAFMFREEAETALSSQAGLAMESVEE